MGECKHCDLGKAFEEFLKEAEVGEKAHSTVHVLWPTYIENVSLTKDIGGWEEPTLHSKLAEVTLQGFQNFQTKVLPSLAEDDVVKKSSLDGISDDDTSAAFRLWQAGLFEKSGATWPEMGALPEYARMGGL